MVGLSTIVPLDAADVFITDDEMPAGALAVLSEHVGEVIVARPPDAARPSTSSAR